MHALANTLDSKTVSNFLPKRRVDSRKGQNGRVLVVGGSTIYHGAPVLASLAALRAGTDLVYTAVPKNNVASTRALSANLIVVPMADQKLTLGASKKLVGAVPKEIDSAAIGMGLVVAEKGALANLISSLVDADVRLLLDAGALRSDILPLVGSKNCVLSPHAGEYARLFGNPPPEKLEERTKQVEARALEHSVTILLKGPTDIISDGNTTYHVTKSAPAMTVGGTGDVLSGIVGSLLACNRNSLEAAAAAAFVNAEAGLAVQAKMGHHMMATDLLDEIPRAMMSLES